MLSRVVKIVTYIRLKIMTQLAHLTRFKWYIIDKLF